MNRQEIAMHARIELARRCFWDYCRLRAGDFYKPDRPHLVRLCNELQAFSESNEKVMIVCEPPRHGKSRTAGLFTEWLFGRDNTVKVMKTFPLRSPRACATASASRRQTLTL